MDSVFTMLKKYDQEHLIAFMNKLPETMKEDLIRVKFSEAANGWNGRIISPADHKMQGSRVGIGLTQKAINESGDRSRGVSRRADDG